MSVEHEVPVMEGPRVTAGIDWASTDHAVAVVDAHGVQQDRFSVTHSRTGLCQLVRRLARAGVSEIAIERPDGRPSGRPGESRSGSTARRYGETP